jgi:hypothetical protein
MLRHQAQIRFMNYGGGLQRLSRAFVSKIMIRQPAQLVVDERRQHIERFLAPVLPIREESRDNFRRFAGRRLHGYWRFLPIAASTS